MPDDASSALSTAAQPSLHTARLLLRPFVPADVAWLVPLLGVREVAMQTLTVPHPYHAAHAEQFVALQAERTAPATGITWAAGTVYLNRCDHADLYLPWGGVKTSGLGRVNGREGLRQASETKSFHVRTRFV